MQQLPLFSAPPPRSSPPLRVTRRRMGDRLHTHGRFGEGFLGVSGEQPRTLASVDYVSTPLELCARAPLCFLAAALRRTAEGCPVASPTKCGPERSGTVNNESYFTSLLSDCTARTRTRTYCRWEFSLCPLYNGAFSKKVGSKLRFDRGEKEVSTERRAYL